MTSRGCVITGTSRGVGRALSFQIAERGFFPILLGRPSAAQEETEALLAARGYDFLSIPCDLEKAESVRSAATQVLARAGAPQVLVHNAGTIERASINELSEASWERQLEVNLNAPFRLTRALLPAMLAERQGRILFVSSISAVVGTPHQSAYHASKAGVVGMMRCLAEELRDSGLMTAALLPGSIDTDMLAGSGFRPRMSSEDVARTLAFYCADAALAHNGAVIEMFGV